MTLICLDILSDSILFAKWTYTEHVTQQIINRCLSDDDLCDYHHGNAFFDRISMTVYVVFDSLVPALPKNVALLVREKLQDMKWIGWCNYILDHTTALLIGQMLLIYFYFIFFTSKQIKNWKWVFPKWLLSVRAFVTYTPKLHSKVTWPVTCAVPAFILESWV